MIDDNKFQAMRLDAEAVFAALYLIDSSTLNEVQLGQHQNAMAAAYLALSALENARLGELNDGIKQKLLEMADALKAMQQEVRGSATPHEKLAFVAEGVGTLANVATLLQRV